MKVRSRRRAGARRLLAGQGRGATGTRRHLDGEWCAGRGCGKAV